MCCSGCCSGLESQRRHAVKEMTVYVKLAELFVFSLANIEGIVCQKRRRTQFCPYLKCNQPVFGVC